MRRAVVFVTLLGVALVFSLIVAVPAAFAGHASTGELLFYPCTDCHPVTLDAAGNPIKALPNGFKGHQIVLESHDKLGQGNAACLVCHDDPAKDPGKLKLIDGSLIDITGNVSLVCYRCHENKYKEFKAGEHGKHQPQCTSAGCHDPHSPAWIYAAPLRPFVGTGFQARAVSDRIPFKALMTAPPAAPVDTPSWLVVGATIGFIICAAIIGGLLVGRPTR